MILSVVLVHIEGVIHSYFYNASANVGAMVGNTLEVGENIRKDEPVFNCTLTLLKSDDVSHLDLVTQIVNHLLKRIDLCGNVKVVLRLGAVGQLKYIVDRSAENAKLLDRLVREGDLFISQLLAGLNNIDRVVGYTLIVTDDM